MGKCPDSSVQFINTTLAIPISESDTRIHLFPNPASDYLNISGQDINELRLYDIFGKTLRKETDEAKISHLDLRNLPAGFYFINIYLASGTTFSKRIIITN